MNDQPELTDEEQQEVQQMAENLKDDVEQPRRKKFHDEVAERISYMVDLIVSDVPELRGIVAQLIWDMDIPAKDLPFGIVRGRDITNPLMRLRCLEQTTKMLRSLTEGTLETVQLADKALIDLNKQISEKQQELKRKDEEVAASTVA